METQFLADQENCINIDLESWRTRPFMDKALEVYATMFDYWL